MLVPHARDHPSRHRPSGPLVPRAFGRDAARNRGAALARRALRVRAAGCARRRAIASVLSSEDPQGRGARDRPARGALGVLRVESRSARRDRRVRVRGEAGQTRRELRPRVLRLERDHQMKDEQVKESVKQKYGQAALRVLGGERGDCGCASDPVSGNLYDAAETAALPEGAVRASLGCGNPTALAELHAGEVVVRGALPAAVRRDMELWVGCVAGALEEVEYRRLLAEVGFEGIGVEPTRIYEFDDARAVGGELISAFVRAHKPLG